MFLEVQKHKIIFDTKYVYYKEWVRNEKACGLIAKVLGFDDVVPRDT